MKKRPSRLLGKGRHHLSERALAARGRLKELREFMQGRPDDFPPAQAEKLAKQCKNALGRRVKEAERAYRQNDDFSDFVHREFKREIRNKGPERNPDMSAEDWLDAFEEFFKR